MGLFGDSLRPPKSSQAKRLGTWEELMTRLTLCVLPDDLAQFEREVAAEELKIPPAWRAPLADQIQLKREEIAADDIGQILRERFDF